MILEKIFFWGFGYRVFCQYISSPCIQWSVRTYVITNQNEIAKIQEKKRKLLDQRLTLISYNNM